LRIASRQAVALMSEKRPSPMTSTYRITQKLSRAL
jgi:hypothetical protein